MARKTRRNGNGANRNAAAAAAALMKLAGHPAYTPPAPIQAAPKSSTGEPKIWIQTPHSGFQGTEFGAYWASPAPTLSLGTKRRRNRRNRSRRGRRTV